jgi:SAM-dependent methyltransferase
MPNSDRTDSLGAEILDALSKILKRCEESGLRLGYPGEGGERAFRGWLVSDLLSAVLGWPVERIVVGERFDVLLQDADGFPVATIETKEPYHRASKKEREDFERRLSGFGTLRHAYFTNGNEWERLDIFSPTGVLEIQSRFAFALGRAAAEEAEAFFAPLAGFRYFKTAPRRARHRVAKDNPHILQALAADLDQAIGDFASLLGTVLAGFRGHKAGEQVRGIALSLFDLWCDKSLTVSPRQAGELVSQQIAAGAATARDIARVISELGIAGTAATAVADRVAVLRPEQRSDPAAVADALWPAFSASVEKLCAQSAHVILARALLYRIGEDQSVFPRLLSGDGMAKLLSAPLSPVLDASGPATDLLLRVQDSMRGFLPAVYELGEFDWWQVRHDKRAALAARETAWLRGIDAEFERTAQRLLRILDGYFFGQVDVDVWRNVYQHYLPEEERQKLGGFYTPDELVDLLLDLAGFVVEHEGLCKLSFIDPACGSGAFVTNALARLLRHLDADLPCHAELSKRGVAAWKRAEAILDVVARNLHAVDLHPFAAFLTTVNVLFMLMPTYVKAREKNRNYSLDLQIFSSDSLEKHDEDLIAPDLFTRLNARVQLTEESFRRYQQMLKKRFDRVFGNPPWGGVLKGRLAPVYDRAKKTRFAREYPASAQGKYDVYGLFIERALQILKPDGRFALLTQCTFLDKEWSAGLRRLLTTKAQLKYLVVLNPFGQLFFHAMNTPSLTVADATDKTDLDSHCLTVLSAPPTDLGASDEAERRKKVVSTIRQAIDKVSSGHRTASVGFARAARIKVRALQETAKDRWNLLPVKRAKPARARTLAASEILDASQGVTPGGCLDLFLMPAEKASALGLEAALLHKAIKSKEAGRWSVAWKGRVLLYPYVLSGGKAAQAFALRPDEVADPKLAETVRRLGLRHALDFEKQLDPREIEIVRRGINPAAVKQLLDHRIALGLVKYPAAAKYLVEHYERLEGRVFEKKRFTQTGKHWYEYHRPRDPRLMLAPVRIISPTLVKSPRFALDSAGYLSDHACLYLQPTAKTNAGCTDLRNQLSDAVGRDVSIEDVMKYCLAFLNSVQANERLVTARCPTPKGFYPVNGSSLREIAIAPPAKPAATSILEAVTRLTTAGGPSESDALEKELCELVSATL